MLATIGMSHFGAYDTGKDGSAYLFLLLLFFLSLFGLVLFLAYTRNARLGIKDGHSAKIGCLVLSL